MGGLAAYLAIEEPGRPSPAPASPQRSSSPLDTGDARGTALYPPTALEGHWVSAPLRGRRAGQRITLQVRGTAWVVWLGDRDQPEQRILDYEAAHVEGGRVELRPVGVSDAVALYRWTRSGDGLRLRLLRRTPHAGPSHLVTVPFSRA